MRRLVSILALMFTGVIDSHRQPSSQSDHSGCIQVAGFRCAMPNVIKANMKAKRSKLTGAGVVSAEVVAMDEDNNVLTQLTGFSVLYEDDREVQVSSLDHSSSDIGPTHCTWITMCRGAECSFRMTAGHVIDGNKRDVIAVELESMSTEPPGSSRR